MTSSFHHDKVSAVYEPTVTGLPPLRRYAASVWERRPFIWHLARTDMKAQHYATVLGFVWLVADPLLLAATFYLIRAVFKSGGSAEQNRYLIAHLIMGVSFFYFTRDVLLGGAQSIQRHRMMVLNTGAPRGVFPVVALARATIDLIPTVIVYFMVHAVLRQPWGTSLFLLPFATVLLAMFSLGVGLMLAPAVVFVPDVGALLPYLVRIWMYVTPVMYAASEIPAGVRPILSLNPLYPFFAMLESIVQGRVPDMGDVTASALWAVGALLVGTIVFLLRERDYAVRL
jgi:teichoic acid transport system permease protein